MRFLIDGYNLMYAGGLLGKRLGPEAFRRVRNRFLNQLSDALGPLDAHQTTVVFDAASAPAGVPDVGSHKGLSVVFAIDDETADDRIEDLIRHHSHPRSLTVVSSDRRIRETASRRRATAITSERFWVSLDARRDRRVVAGKAGRVALPESTPNRVDPDLSAEDAAHWLAT
ncbi:MAG: NYN domain-containing protein, partial [Isosphaeraceae bacterium]